MDFESGPVINKYHHGNRVPDGAVNIMRGSAFGNPFVIGADGSREDVIRKYRAHLWKSISDDDALSEKVRALHGKTLCCCCAPLACHGDILVKAAAYLATEGHSEKK